MTGNILPTPLKGRIGILPIKPIGHVHTSETRLKVGFVKGLCFLQVSLKRTPSLPDGEQHVGFNDDKIFKTVI